MLVMQVLPQDVAILTCLPKRCTISRLAAHSTLNSPLSPFFCSSAYTAKQPPSTFLTVQFQGLDARVISQIKSDKEHHYDASPYACRI